jgi:hypothetical protein
VPQHDDDIYLGQAVPWGSIMGAASATQPLRGIGPAGRVYAIDLGNPAPLDAAAVCAAQAIAGAGNAVINGTRSAFDFTLGQRTATLGTLKKIGRGVQMVSTNAGDTTQTVLITGRDIYGARMSQVKTLNGTTPVLFTKMFRWVDLVTVSAAMTGNLTVGTYDAFGFPIMVELGAYVIKIGWGNVYGPDPGSVTTADLTNPATTSTSDVRGYYVPSSAADNTKVLTVVILLRDEQVGANATRRQAFGVTQA